jgi:hypothetical protein
VAKIIRTHLNKNPQPRCQDKLKISRLVEELVAKATAMRQNNEIFNLSGNPKGDTANFLHNVVLRAQRIFNTLSPLSLVLKKVGKYRGWN